MNKRNHFSFVLSFVMILSCCLFSQKIFIPEVSAENIYIPYDAVSYGEHYYLIYDDLQKFDDKSFDMARRLCQARGGHIAVIETEDEDSFLNSYVKTQNYKNVYFGMISGESAWINEYGAEQTYFNWAEGSPQYDMSTKLYAAYDSDYSSGWAEQEYFVNECAVYLCEWDSGIKVENPLNINSVSDTPLNSEEFFELDGKYYKIFDVSLTRLDAAKLCVSMGGQLVQITSEELQNIITDRLNQCGTKNLYWIGLNCCEADNNWKWSADQPAEYTNWNPGEPNNGNGDCYYAVINRGSDLYENGKWIAEPNQCERSREDNFYTNTGFICEWIPVCVSDEGAYISHYAEKSEWHINSPAACEDEGVKSRACDRCNQTSAITEVIPANGHTISRNSIVDIDIPRV